MMRCDYVRSAPITRLQTSLMRVFTALFCLFLGVSSLHAHPHVFVEARTKLVFDDNGNAIAVQHVFRFDDAFSAFAVQGFDTNKDGVYSREELAELAKVNIESMADFGYFTFGDNTRVELDFETPTDYWLEVATVSLKDYWMMKPEDFEAMEEDIRLNGGTMQETTQLLELHFTLPMKEKSDSLDAITLDVYDPTYYVDFRFAEPETAVGTVNPPSQCNIVRREPPPLDAATAYALAQIGPEQRELPPELQYAAASQINQIVVTCGDSAVQASFETSSPAVGTNRADDVEASVRQDVLTIDGTSSSDLEVGFWGQFFGTIALKQKEFYQELQNSLRSFRSNPNAIWILMGLSFAYGVFHAAGPGHGKAIITSYVVANNETLKKGILLSFASAFAQAITAITIVVGLAVIFNFTSISLQNTARFLEVGSYALIVGLGIWLLWQKMPLLAADGHGTHSPQNSNFHEHKLGNDGVCLTCGHAHAPTPDMLEGELTLRRSVAIILAVGLRPCSGAVVVLVFALSQSMLSAGVASTLVMALGTGITVSLLAGLAVGAKGIAIRLFGYDSAMASRMHQIIEIFAAVVVLLLGLTLLISALLWGGTAF